MKTPEQVAAETRAIFESRRRRELVEEARGLWPACRRGGKAMDRATDLVLDELVTLAPDDFDDEDVSELRSGLYDLVVEELRR